MVVVKVRCVSVVLDWNVVVLKVFIGLDMI